MAHNVSQQVRSDIVHLLRELDSRRADVRDAALDALVALERRLQKVTTPHVLKDRTRVASAGMLSQTFEVMTPDGTTVLNDNPEDAIGWLIATGVTSGFDSASHDRLEHTADALDETSTRLASVAKQLVDEIFDSDDGQMPDWISEEDAALLQSHEIADSRVVIAAAKRVAVNAASQLGLGDADARALPLSRSQTAFHVLPPEAMVAFLVDRSIEEGDPELQGLSRAAASDIVRRRMFDRPGLSELIDAMEGLPVAVQDIVRPTYLRQLRDAGDPVSQHEIAAAEVYAKDVLTAARGGDAIAIESVRNAANVMLQTGLFGGVEELEPTLTEIPKTPWATFDAKRRQLQPFLWGELNARGSAFRTGPRGGDDDQVEYEIDVRSPQLDALRELLLDQDEAVEVARALISDRAPVAMRVLLDEEGAMDVSAARLQETWPVADDDDGITGKFRDLGESLVLQSDQDIEDGVQRLEQLRATTGAAQFDAAARSSVARLRTVLTGHATANESLDEVLPRLGLEDLQPPPPVLPPPASDHPAESLPIPTRRETVAAARRLFASGPLIRRIYDAPGRPRAEALINVLARATQAPRSVIAESDGRMQQLGIDGMSDSRVGVERVADRAVAGLAEAREVDPDVLSVAVRDTGRALQQVRPFTELDDRHSLASGRTSDGRRLFPPRGEEGGPMLGPSPLSPRPPRNPHSPGQQLAEPGVEAGQTRPVLPERSPASRPEAPPVEPTDSAMRATAPGSGRAERARVRPFHGDGPPAGLQRLDVGAQPAHVELTAEPTATTRRQADGPSPFD